MTAQYATVADDPLRGAADPVDAARRHIVAAALRETSGPAQVGLELEFHLVDLADPARRPSWAQVEQLVDALPPMPSGSTVTTEPGGQLELSTPPTTGVGESVAALGADERRLRAALRTAGYGIASLGTDPAREPRRINPSRRYAAMERHFAAVGCERPGTAMMTATAAMQVNLDAGPREGWAQRLGLVRALGPVLVAASACSPLLAGQASGWASMRQQVWHGIDHDRSDPVVGDDAAQAWATYALNAAVMLVREGDDALPVLSRVPFRAWLRGAGPIERPPTTADLDYHLTTLFPPVRPRGYLEIRCLDAAPARWWPALAAFVATLVDDPVAAVVAAAACTPVREEWTAAARDGLRDPALHRAVFACAQIAAERCEPAVRPQLEAFAELVARGRTPGDELRERAAATDPLTVLVEEATRV